MSKIVISLDDADLIDLQQILLDEDEAGALAFLQRRVAQSIPLRGTRNCDSSRCNPYLLRPERPKKNET
jgi:hypothetical protein